ncbi:MAG: hypothetical protein M3261_07115 [Thermoproteota archaeon]|nr:hypothetical protein [Thermoproteota archaeon]
MNNINKDNEKKNPVATAAMFLLLATILVVAVVNTPLATRIITPLILQSASAQAFIDQEGNSRPEPKAPIAVSQDGNNVYIVWWTNKSENWEVMFRASNDGGQTFSDKINLSNSTDTDSQNAEIVAAGNNVFVSWWETSPETGSSESVLRVSTDAGQTFGPMVMLGVNGTINTATGNTTGSTTTAAEQGEEEVLPNGDVVPTEGET